MTDERLAKEASVLMHTYEDYAGIRAKLLKEKEQSQKHLQTEMSASPVYHRIDSMLKTLTVN